jgi:hypothetical protein
MNTLKINQKKILETKALLTEVITDPFPFKGDSTLISALKSQSALAMYSNENRDIASCSLNTLKRASESLLTRGFVDLDELRINAKNALESATLGQKATTKTRIGLKYKVDKLQAQLSTMNKSNFLQTCIIEELRLELKQMAYSNQSSEQAKKMYQEFNKRLEAKLFITLNGKL